MCTNCIILMQTITNFNIIESTTVNDHQVFGRKVLKHKKIRKHNMNVIFRALPPSHLSFIYMGVSIILKSEFCILEMTWDCTCIRNKHVRVMYSPEFYMSLCVKKKKNNLEPDKVRHKSGCTVREDG